MSRSNIKMNRNEEQAFRNAIKDAPYNQVTRLVFADWLEENGRSNEAKRQRQLSEASDRLSSLDGFYPDKFVAESKTKFFSPVAVDGVDLNHIRLPNLATLSGDGGDTDYLIPDNHADSRWNEEGIRNLLESHDLISHYHEDDGHSFENAELPRDIRRHFGDSMLANGHSGYEWGDNSSAYVGTEDHDIHEGLIEATRRHLDDEGELEN